MADVVSTCTLGDTTITTVVLRPRAHVVIGRIVDTADLPDAATTRMNRKYLPRVGGDQLHVTHEITAFVHDLSLTLPRKKLVETLYRIAARASVDRDVTTDAL